METIYNRAEHTRLPPAEKKPRREFTQEIRGLLMSALDEIWESLGAEDTWENRRLVAHDRLDMGDTTLSTIACEWIREAANARQKEVATIDDEAEIEI